MDWKKRIKYMGPYVLIAFNKKYYDKDGVGIHINVATKKLRYLRMCITKTDRHGKFVDPNIYEIRHHRIKTFPKHEHLKTGEMHYTVPMNAFKKQGSQEIEDNDEKNEWFRNTIFD